MWRPLILRRISNLSPKETVIQVENTKLLIDSISSYYTNLISNSFLHNTDSIPLQKFLPITAVPFSEVLRQIETSIYPRTKNEQDPHNFVGPTSLSSWEAIQGTILTKIINSVSFTKFSSPISADIEVTVADWVASMLQLPECFFHTKGPGGGLTHGCSAECILTAMSCSQIKKPSNGNCVVYASSESHFSVEKSAKVLGMIFRNVPTVFNENSQNFTMNIEMLKTLIQKDLNQGLTPTFVCGTLGGYNFGGNDDLKLIGEIASDYDVWFHIEASYAGNVLILPELRYLMDGVEKCTSLSVDCGKLMLASFDSALMWVKDSNLLTKCLSENRSYLSAHGNQDFKDWQLPLGRDCKGFKLWMVIQQMGVSGLQSIVRNHLEASKIMEELVKNNQKLEIITESPYGIVVFRVRGNNEKTENLLRIINENENIVLGGGKVNDLAFIKFCTGNNTENFSNVREAYEIINSYLD